jgi:hypothetical protein
MRYLRDLRGWLYRRLPAGWPSSHQKRMAGFGRRWNLEAEGWNQEGFCQIFWEKALRKQERGKILELAAGDGLVGSLGRWLEENRGWTAVCEETQTLPLRQLQANRPQARCIRLEELRPACFDVDCLTSRSGKRTSLIFRMMKKEGVRPRVVGVWNRSRRPLWSRRLRAMGYEPVLCQDRMEFYRCR